MAVAVTATSEYTVEQLEEMLKQKKVQARENGPQMRKKLEAYCLKEFGMSLTSVVSSTRKAPTPRTFVNPSNHEEYTYPGKGAYPDWLKRKEQRASYAKK